MWSENQNLSLNDIVHPLSNGIIELECELIIF